jgi:hypothetical protein
MGKLSEIAGEHNNELLLRDSKLTKYWIGSAQKFFPIAPGFGLRRAHEVQSPANSLETDRFALLGKVAAIDSPYTTDQE